MATVTEQIAVQSVVQRKPKKLTPRQRALAEQYRDELFAEYAEGKMPPEKKAVVLEILGPDFFSPVDKHKAQFERHLNNAAAYYERLAEKKAQKQARKSQVTEDEQGPSFATRDGRVLHPDGSVTKTGRQARKTREQGPSFVTRDGRVLHPDGSISTL